MHSRERWRECAANSRRDKLSRAERRKAFSRGDQAMQNEFWDIRENYASVRIANFMYGCLLCCEKVYAQICEQL